MKQRRCQAFTLLEALVALAIIGIALAGLLRLHLSSLALVERSTATERAGALAENRLAETLAGGYPELGSDAGVEQAGPLTLQWRRNIVEYRPPATASDKLPLRRVDVEVSWQEGRSPRSVRLSAAVTDRKLLCDEPSDNLALP
jgi:type II secretion system protein I